MNVLKSGLHSLLILSTVFAGLIVFSPNADALPMYALRSGRTCGNCHISPTYQEKSGFENPELADRKCNMSCISCHVNPTGGGLRNASGRYYGQSTLAMLPLQERSYHDYGREALSKDLINSFRSGYTPPVYGAGTSSIAKKWRIPGDYNDVLRGDGQGQNGGWSVFGKPLTGPSRYAYWDGRYHDLNADPMINLGADIRAAYWTGSKTPFPMQVDLHGALHLIEHVTAMGTFAARGRVGGTPETLTQDRFPFFARNAFLMVHELPMAAWMKAGIFTPNFGTYIDDHTSFTREFFEQDVSNSDDTAYGVEIGMAPNYPYAHASVFKNWRPFGAPEDVDTGWGATAAAGWRDLWFNFGVSGMIKRRDLLARGNIEALAISWGLNPFTISNSIPITYMGEFTVGRNQRVVTGEKTSMWASYHELWFLLFNGINLRAKYDVGRRDAELADTLQHRFVLGMDLTVIPGATIVPMGRLLLYENAPTELDFFLQVHVWL